MAIETSRCLARYQLPEFDPSWGLIKRGIEKESLRIKPDGCISNKPHPRALGSALTNPYITTDFSEALLEFITPVYTNIDECLGMLENIHRFTLHNLEQDELLWVASMPCPLSSDSKIPIAQYGDSNIGRMKTLYRKGLHNRYGSFMQIIAGLHYNFSMPETFWEPYRELKGSSDSLQDFQTKCYLQLIRNFHRYSWLLLYLFGASPAACRCFVEGREHKLEDFDAGSVYLPDATCLRMGNLGYRSEAQQSLFVCYNELETYVQCLSDAMNTPYPKYEQIGQSANGDYLQINTNLLQLENEFYSTIRPKRVAESGEKPLQALTRGGIEYVEVRALDLNPFVPLGIDANQIRFLDAFLLHCLLSDSPQCDPQEYFETSQNLANVVERGRDWELELSNGGRPKPLRGWARELLNDLEHSASLLDSIHSGSAYLDSIEQQKRKVEKPHLTPSGQILNTMQEDRISYFEFAMIQSRKHRDYFMNKKLNSSVVENLQQTAAASMAKQEDIERSDSMDFDAYLKAWNAS